MYNKTYGTKYEATKGLRRVEIAKLIREDLKAAVKAGTLPKAKYAVRCSRGRGINVEVSQIPFAVLSREYFTLRADHASVPADKHWSWKVDVNLRDGHRPARERCTEEAHVLQDAVKAIVAAYNYDRSDIQTDYFDVRFYSSIDLEEDGAALVADLLAAEAARALAEAS